MDTIAKIELFHVEYPLTTHFYPSWIPGFPQTQNCFDLIKITTDDGIIGYSAGVAMGKERAKLGELISPYLIGESATDIPMIQQRLREISYLGWNNFWIEPAFWDIKGKIEGKPVCELLGGKPREIKLYASTGDIQSPEKKVEEAEYLYNEGFKAIKLRVHDFDEKNDIKLIEKVSQAIGNKMKIGVDANQGWRVTVVADAPLWDLNRAKRFADACAANNISWLEEPLAMDSYHELSQLTAYSKVPIAGGELHTSGLPELKMMIENKCYNIFQPDATFTGGIFQTHEVVKLCEKNGLVYTPHTWTNGIGFAINMQLFAASKFSDTLEMEYPICPPGWTVEARDVILSQPFYHGRGKIKMSNKPGLGFDIDKRVLKKYGTRYFVMDKLRFVWFSILNRGLKVSMEIDKTRKDKKKALEENCF